MSRNAMIRAGITVCILLPLAIAVLALAIWLAEQALG